MPRASLRSADAPADARQRTWPAQRRLRRAAEFAALATADRRRSIRAARHFLAMTAAWSEPVQGRAAVRFGVTVGRRHARRAIDRSLVKRIVREAARAAAHDLEQSCARGALQLDVGLRLKAARPTASAATLSSAAWRRALRVEADQLLAELARRLAALPAQESGGV